MSDTATAPAVYSGICAVTAALAGEGISKNRRNTQGAGYNFRGIDDVYNSLSRLLSDHRLCILPRVIAREFREAETKNGGALYYTILTVEFDVVSAVDGSRHTVCTVGEAMDSSDKSTNKAMSAAYKYLAFLLFCIPTEGDNDSETHTHEPAPRRSEPQRAPQRSEPARPTTPAPSAQSDEAAAALATLAARGWTRDAVKASGVGLRRLVADTAGDGFGAKLWNRIGKRIVEAQAAGVLDGLIDTYGKPETWGAGDPGVAMKRLDAIKADIAKAAKPSGGAA